MILDHETAGDDGAPGEMQGADFEVVDVPAAAALEVIVMAHAGALVAGLAIGEDDGLDALGLKQEIEGAVDGGDAEATEGTLGALEDLMDGDGALRLGNGAENGIALAGMTLAERGRHRGKVTAQTGVAQGKEGEPD